MSNENSERFKIFDMDVVRVAKDLAAVFVVGVILLVVHELATPFTRGFQCDDETIRYPFKDSTVSSGLCYLLGSGINVFAILVMEYYAISNEHRSNQGGDTESTIPFKKYVRNVYCRLLVWFFGAICSELLTDISKFTAGRLRPHFLDVCQPRVRSGNTEFTIDEYCDKGHRYEYITNYYCSGDPKKQRDTRLSFMSGHSSYSAYSAAFAVFYLQSAVDISKAGLIKPAVQVLIISTAFYTGLTRVSDYKHHWQDVLAGLLQGSFVAAIVSKCLYPALYKTYANHVKSSSQRVRDEQLGEELNRVSY